MNTTRTYLLQIPHVTCSLQVVEEADRILLRAAFSNYLQPYDERLYKAWLTPILHRYQHDRRAIFIEHILTGELIPVGE